MVEEMISTPTMTSSEQSNDNVHYYLAELIKFIL